MLNGQKVWTSYAQFARWGICLARTDPDAPKHAGISYLVVDMTEPGIEIRPLVQITGEAEFNEVFLSDVFVPADHLVGELHHGWAVANTTLAHERGTNFPFKEQVVHETFLQELFELAAANGGLDDPHVADELVQAFVELRVLRLHNWRTLSRLGRGIEPGPESSWVKLAWTDMTQHLSATACAVGGPTPRAVGPRGRASGCGAGRRRSPAAPRRSSARSSASGCSGCRGADRTVAPMTDPSAAGHDPAWKRRAVERSLGTARARALDRSVAFLAAATELFAETGRIDFTVQDIVDRSGLSLRAFYVHFASKDDLLLALFEEMIAQFAAELRAEVEEEHDALAQLRRYVQGFIGRAESSRGSGGRALGAYHLRLADERPADLAAALAPQVVLLAEIVDRGVAEGRFRTDLDGDALTMLLTTTLMSIAEMGVLGVHVTGTAVAGAQVWAWCERAVLA